MKRFQSSVALTLIFCLLVSTFPISAGAEFGRVTPRFNVIVNTIAAHPESENRVGVVHGETHEVEPWEIDSLLERLNPILAKVPEGETVVLSFYLSPYWDKEKQTKLVKLIERRVQPQFPNNPLKLELRHPYVPLRLRSQVARPGIDEILLVLKQLEESAPSVSDRRVIKVVRSDIEKAQTVAVETDSEGEGFPRRLEAPEHERRELLIYGAIRALVTGILFYGALKFPEIDKTTKSMAAWAIILSRASIDFGTAVSAQSFGQFLAKHQIPRPPLVRSAFWEQINNWYCGKSSAEKAERAELIKQGVANYLLFVLILTPFTQMASAYAGQTAAMDWNPSYFAWTAAISAVFTVAFVSGAKGLRKLRQLGEMSGAAIDRKYGRLSVIGAGGDLAKTVPSLVSGVIGFFIMGYMAYIQLSDAIKAKKAKPKVNRIVFIDSSLPDVVRTRSIVPKENIDDTRLFGRKLPGENPEVIEGEVENFVNWVLHALPRHPAVEPMACEEAILAS